MLVVIYLINTFQEKEAIGIKKQDRELYQR